MSALFLQIKPSRTKKTPPITKIGFIRIIFLDLWFYFAHLSLLSYFIIIQLNFHRYSVIELYPKLAKIDFTKIV
ncbi:hypothetical protein HMPREF1407_00802 [Helicobacter pylori GAM244Ai]|nr:hypothetical protein HMPREF1407_00802 [Helicobacter pylori GAM244Ai]